MGYVYSAIRPNFEDNISLEQAKEIVLKNQTVEDFEYGE